MSGDISLDRRSLLGGLALTCAASLPAAAAPPPKDALPAVPPLMAGPMADRDHVASVMERAGVDGLILTDPISVNHLTGLETTQFMRSLPMGSALLAIVPRDPRMPVGVIMNSFNYYYSYAGAQPAEGVAVFQFSEARDPRADASNTTGLLSTGAPPMVAGKPARLPDAGEAPPTAVERRRMARSEQQTKRWGVASDRAAAFARAAREFGLERGRLACEALPGSPAWQMAEALHPMGSVQSAAPVLARIRLIKTPAEIQLMRYAAQANAAAAQAACRAVRAGANSAELRRSFFLEAARRGGVGAWISINGMTVNGYVDTFDRGQAFMIDAVSTYQGYHGDYGRTVFVGEPTRSMNRHTKAIAHAWSAVRERLRPGLRFSEIPAIGQSALTKGGFDTKVRITPHSIGILHTDAGGIGDIELEPGMVVSVDFPVLATGMGGSAHLEDLALITSDGCTILNEMADPVIVV
jgi:Xaa-Pro aminopeptidase